MRTAAPLCVYGRLAVLLSVPPITPPPSTAPLPHLLRPLLWPAHQDSATQRPTWNVWVMSQAHLLLPTRPQRVPPHSLALQRYPWHTFLTLHAPPARPLRASRQKAGIYTRCAKCTTTSNLSLGCPPSKTPRSSPGSSPSTRQRGNLLSLRAGINVRIGMEAC